MTTVIIIRFMCICMYIYIYIYIERERERESPWYEEHPFAASRASAGPDPQAQETKPFGCDLGSRSTISISISMNTSSISSIIM